MRIKVVDHFIIMSDFVFHMISSLSKSSCNWRETSLSTLTSSRVLIFIWKCFNSSCFWAIACFSLPHSTIHSQFSLVPLSLPINWNAQVPLILTFKPLIWPSYISGVWSTLVCPLFERDVWTSIKNFSSKLKQVNVWHS